MTRRRACRTGAGSVFLVETSLGSQGRWVRERPPSALSCPVAGSGSGRCGGNPVLGEAGVVGRPGPAACGDWLLDDVIASPESLARVAASIKAPAAGTAHVRSGSQRGSAFSAPLAVGGWGAVLLAVTPAGLGVSVTPPSVSGARVGSLAFGQRTRVEVPAGGWEGHVCI